MKAEQIILKGVKHRQQKGNLILDLISLNEHFDGLLIHKTDVLVLEEGELVNEYIKFKDVNFDNAIPKEVVVEEEPAAETTGMTYAEAEELMKLGKLVKLPEWEGFWFRNNVKEETLVLTKEGEVLDTPWDICKESNDWIEAEATPEQQQILENYFDSLKNPNKMIEAVVTEETLTHSPELVEEGLKAGDKVLVDANEEEAPKEEVATDNAALVSETPVAEQPAPKKRRTTKKTEE